MSGQPADLANLHQNDRVIIEISGQMQHNTYRQMGIIDLLPAGLEIESTLTGDDGKPYTFLNQLGDMNMTDARDDRFVASFSIGSQYVSDDDKKKPEPQPIFRVAYIARAVTTGTFVLPAADVSDMYAPLDPRSHHAGAGDHRAVVEVSPLSPSGRGEGEGPHRLVCPCLAFPVFRCPSRSAAGGQGASPVRHRRLLRLRPDARGLRRRPALPAGHDALRQRLARSGGQERHAAARLPYA